MELFQKFIRFGDAALPSAGEVGGFPGQVAPNGHNSKFGSQVSSTLAFLSDRTALLANGHPWWISAKMLLGGSIDFNNPSCPRDFGTRLSGPWLVYKGKLAVDTKAPVAMVA